MATPTRTSEDDLRGRSLYVRRGEITYSSLRLRVPSQERPLHISPDRITRHASPGRQSIVADEQEVVPRIPQPYRTSFSAVTSPRRVPRPSNLTPLSRTCPFRSTMPGRIMSPERQTDYTSPERQRTDYTFRSYDHRRGASKHSLDSSTVLAGAKREGTLKQNGTKLASRSAENVLNGERKVSIPGFSTPQENINKSLVNGDAAVRAFMSISNGTIQTTDDSISNTMESTDFTDGGTSPEPNMFTFEVEPKKLITMEYVHVNDISYFKALDKKSKLQAPNEETERIVDNMMRGKKREWWLRHKEQHGGMSLPTSPDEAPKLRQQRSGTLPSETVLAGKAIASTPVKRSLSTSITNFFKRMSPKSLRRSSRGSQKSKTPDSSTNSLQAVFCDSADDLSLDSDQSGSDGKKKGKSPKVSPIRNLLSQSFRKSREALGGSKSPSSASSSKEANLSKEAISKSPSPQPPTVDSQSPSSSSQVLSTDSARILKSIENNSQVVAEKNVYHQFKEKQSPKRMSEAMSMKPQALKAVEFHDQYLNASDTITLSDTAIDDVDNIQKSVQSLSIKKELQKVSSLPGTLDRIHGKRVKEPISTSSGMLLLPKNDPSGGIIHRSNDPPKTLDVREVAKLQKAVFQFPNMSAESIGQCSVNLYTSGSEPSLVSRNGQRSSVTASKRTLVSQDTNPSPKVDADNRASSQPTLLDSGTMPTTMTTESFESIDTTPKTPSYMKISCALSGYNRYNTYTSPKQEAKLRVIKLGEQNGSHSSLSSQQSDSSAEVRNYSDLSIKVTDEPEPIKNGIAPSELLTNGSSHHSISSGAATSATTNGAEHVSIVMNGRTEGDSVTNEVGEEDSNDKYITKAMVNLQPSGSPTMMSASELKLQWEDKRKTEMRSAVSTPSPSKDGHYYFPVLEREVSRIRGLCAPCEVDMHDESLPEEASGKIRAAIGKSNLLINKKFEQFRGLCERNINQSSDEGFLTTVTDLAGFWDMVCLQISDINTMFKDIETMRQSGWTISKDSPVKTQSTTKGCLKGGKSPRGKTSSTATPVKTAKPAVSAKAEEAMKARDLARKRLLAAKRAGRQRKASQSDKDEIEIFVAE